MLEIMKWNERKKVAMLSSVSCLIFCTSQVFFNEKKNNFHRPWSVIHHLPLLTKKFEQE
jgi:hypothetical protein